MLVVSPPESSSFIPGRRDLGEGGDLGSATRQLQQRAPYAFS